MYIQLLRGLYSIYIMQDLQLWLQAIIVFVIICMDHVRSVRTVRMLRPFIWVHMPCVLSAIYAEAWKLYNNY